MTSFLRRLAGLLVVGTSLVLLSASPALADPATPTNYQSEVVAVDGPGVAGVEIVGGDAFVRLTAVRGMTVVVLGYEQEEYIRFGPDGRVSVNQRSPATYLNDDRYANVEVPADASAGAEPRWEDVSVDGTYSWHDHRTHWMSPTPPAAVLESGEGATVPIFDWVLPLAVDGDPGGVIGSLTWIPSSSAAPWFVIALLAMLAVAAFGVRLRSAQQAMVLLVLAILALVAGVSAIASQPPEGRAYDVDVIGPPIVLGLGVFAAVQARSSERAGARLVLIGSAALAAWNLLRIGVLTHPILPTVLPYSLDRLLTAVVLGGAVGLATAIVAATTWQNRTRRVGGDGHRAS
jgi:hypothetical protein